MKNLSRPLMFGQNANIGGRPWIYQCLLSLNDTSIHEIGYLAVELDEEDFYQFVAIDLRHTAFEFLCCGFFKLLTALILSVVDVALFKLTGQFGVRAAVADRKPRRG